MALQIKIVGIFPPKNIMAVKGAAVLSAIENTLKGAVSRLVEDEMEKRVRGWSKRPRFSSKFADLATRLTLTVEPTGTNLRFWAYATLGTKPHPIGGKKGNFIRVREGYRSKTGPGDKYGGPGSYGGSYYYTLGVWHPGVKPREFEKWIALRNEKKIFAMIQAAVDRAAK